MNQRLKDLYNVEGSEEHIVGDIEKLYSTMLSEESVITSSIDSDIKNLDILSKNSETLNELIELPISDDNDVALKVASMAFESITDAIEYPVSMSYEAMSDEKKSIIMFNIIKAIFSIIDNITTFIKKLMEFIRQKLGLVDKKIKKLKETYKDNGEDYKYEYLDMTSVPSYIATMAIVIGISKTNTVEDTDRPILFKNINMVDTIIKHIDTVEAVLNTSSRFNDIIVSDDSSNIVENTDKMVDEIIVMYEDSGVMMPRETIKELEGIYNHMKIYGLVAVGRGRLVIFIYDSNSKRDIIMSAPIPANLLLRKGVKDRGVNDRKFAIEPLDRHTYLELINSAERANKLLKEKSKIVSDDISKIKKNLKGVMKDLKAVSISNAAGDKGEIKRYKKVLRDINASTKAYIKIYPKNLTSLIDIRNGCVSYLELLLTPHTVEE